VIIRRYILQSLVRPFFIGFGFITFLLTMEMLLDLLDLLIGKGIDVWTVGKLFLLALGWMVALSVPCGVLVATLMTYGRMSQDNEITALRASGVHVFRIVAPTLVLSVILAGGLTGFNNYILPETNFAYASLMQKISRKNPTTQIREGVIINTFRGYSIRINRLDDRTGRMEDVLILDASSDPRSPRTIIASGGTLQYKPKEGILTLELRDGTIHEAEPGSKEGEYRLVAFQTQTLNIPDPGNTWNQSPERRRSDREMPIAQMRREIARLEVEEKKQRGQLESALDDLGLKSLDELARLDPSALPAGALGTLLRGVGKLLGGAKPPTHPSWTPQQQRTLGLIRTRYGEIENLQRKIRRFDVEIQKKFSIPFACVVFVLMGAPLGMLARRGGMTVGLLSAIFFVFYYLCLIGGEQLADRLLFPPWLSMWLPNLVLGGLGIFLMLRAIRSGQVAPPRQRQGVGR
jgi:lipopolysaccharide export system permease protein